MGCEGLAGGVSYPEKTRRVDLYDGKEGFDFGCASAQAPGCQVPSTVERPKNEPISTIVPPAGTPRAASNRNRASSRVSHPLMREATSQQLSNALMARPRPVARLEHLCRYVARSAIATERLSLARDGRVIYGLRRHWRDGTSAVSFDPLTFITEDTGDADSAPSATKRQT